MHDPLSRRQALALAGAGAALLGTTALPRSAKAAEPFSFEQVIAQARALASKPYVEDPKPLPPALAAIDYDAWRDIRFKVEEAPLTGLFRMQMFHPGFLFKHPVDIAVVKHGQSRPVAYSPAMFDYGRNRFEPPLPTDLGFAGFRLHYPLNDPAVMDELVVFLGASYFRFLSRGQHYGLSARGIAIGSGEPGEEFPAFVDYWVEDPGPGVDRIVINAVLDGPSLTGAYRFTIWPGAATGVDVNAVLFPRRTINQLGVAPLTSMFYVSENDRRFTEEFRPEVHDSDGLLLHTQAGEWLWRPLRNPAEARISSFVDTNPRGFGLMQRERSFARYEDLEARYDLRPSYWVEPVGDWGEGEVRLVELPGPDETGDNIVAFWRPKEPVQAGAELRMNYRIRAIGDGSDLHTGGRVRATFQAQPRAAGARGPAQVGVRRFLIDFAGGDLGYFLGDPSRVELVPSVSEGRIVRQFLVPNPVTEGFRAGIDIAIDPNTTTDIRAYLRSGQRALTETWTFPWSRGA